MCVCVYIYIFIYNIYTHKAISAKHPGYKPKLLNVLLNEILFDRNKPLMMTTNLANNSPLNEVQRIPPSI